MIIVCEKKILYLLSILYAKYNYNQPITKTTKFIKKKSKFFFFKKKKRLLENQQFHLTSNFLTFHRYTYQQNN